MKTTLQSMFGLANMFGLSKAEPNAEIGGELLRF